MGFRFRRSVRLLPGIRLNIGKSGISTSIGGRGATVNIGKRGTRATLGLPGTGLSYSTRLTGGEAPPRTANTASPGAASTRSGLSAIVWVVAALLGLLAIGHCSTQMPAPTAAPQATPSSPADLRRVDAGSLNCRAAPNRTAATVRTLKRGEAVTVVAEQGRWVRLTAGCWAAANYLGGSPVAAAPEQNDSLPATGAAAANRSMRHARGRSGLGEGAGGSCSCGEGAVCTGPRGGRYCVTASGKKHYGN